MLRYNSESTCSCPSWLDHGLLASGGGTAVVGGSLAAGRALVQGATSGDLTQVGEAGRAFAGGVVGGVGSVVGGVAHAGQDVVGGVRAGVRSTSTTLFD